MISRFRFSLFKACYILIWRLWDALSLLAQKCVVALPRIIAEQSHLNSFYRLTRAIPFDSVCNFTECMLYLNKIKRADFLAVGHQICREFLIASIKHQKA